MARFARPTGSMPCGRPFLHSTFGALQIEPCVFKASLGVNALFAQSFFGEVLAPVGEKDIALGVALNQGKIEFVAIGERLFINFTAADYKNFRVFIIAPGLPAVSLSNPSKGRLHTFFNRFFQRVHDNNSFRLEIRITSNDNIGPLRQGMADTLVRFSSHNHRMFHSQFFEALEIIRNAKKQIVTFSYSVGFACHSDHSTNFYFFVHVPIINDISYNNRMKKYEVEVKSLLGSKERADALRKKLTEKGARVLGTHSQLNHYFIVPTDHRELQAAFIPLLDEQSGKLLRKILSDGRKISLRTRQADSKVLLVAKASVGDDTSANGVSRIEIEAPVPKTLDELDALLLSAGASYEAKWSREREEYKLGRLLISIDKNAGYGYLAEFEMQVENEADTVAAKKEILDVMAEVGAEELPQKRLERMFSFYNNHWREYYGTEKTFVVE